MQENAVLKFVNALLNEFDFEQANALLEEVESQQKGDVLLRRKELVELCQRLFFSVYIKVFKTIDMKYTVGVIMRREYAKYLKGKDTEVWLVNAIRSYKLNAKILSDEAKIVISEESTNNQEEQLIRRIQELIPKTTMLVNNLERVSTIKK